MKRPEPVPICWPRAMRLVPARYRAEECFEAVRDPENPDSGALLARLSTLTAAAGQGDLDALDPSRVLFGPGAGWINASFITPRPGRFSTSRRGAFYLAGDLETSLAEVRHHLQLNYRREGITQPLDLDYRALTAHLEGRFPDIRSRLSARAPWSAIYAPDDWSAAQRFGAEMRDAGHAALVYASLRHPGGACAAVFDPNAVRACRHDTYLTFRWNGTAVAQVYEKRFLPFP
ncbi:RES family NAD+ phosphorylase [Mesoterricola silvestris]|uniref:RES domain-containing protein n=1 Tax=Mesoterricola silvestris TaxID=2927979 RepID=A0AA48GNZ3_9BACT|nr:RES family NAD+ phosphorylase [Mesoterricola silvestris]BDU73015.1 hypothetical protein METEAL_21890 [Mesoterricola silvestris]